MPSYTAKEDFYLETNNLGLLWENRGLRANDAWLFGMVETDVCHATKTISINFFSKYAVRILLSFIYICNDAENISYHRYFDQVNNFSITRHLLASAKSFLDLFRSVSELIALAGKYLCSERQRGHAWFLSLQRMFVVQRVRETRGAGGANASARALRRVSIKYKPYDVGAWVGGSYAAAW